MKSLNELKSILVPACVLPNAEYRFIGINAKAKSLLAQLDAAELLIDDAVANIESLEGLYIEETTQVVDGSLKFIGVNKASALIAKKLDAAQYELNLAICVQADVEADYMAETLVLVSSD